MFFGLCAGGEFLVCIVEEEGLGVVMEMKRRVKYLLFIFKICFSQIEA